MRKSLLLTFVLVSSLCLGLSSSTFAQQSSPQISSISPSTARAGDQILITGSGFGSTQGSGNVWLGSTYGAVASWSNTQVVAYVASGSKTGVAQVLQGGVWSNSADLTVITPNISAVSPLTAIAGTQITITGTGFGSSQGGGNVWLGSTYGVVVSWSDTQVVANVASGSKTGVAQVLQGGVWSNSVNLTVSTPNITGVTPTTAIAGTQITITGAGFGASQGSGNVWLGSTYGVVVSWSDTQVVANVASGSKTGVVQVLQGGVWSNSVNLTVSTPNITGVTPTTAIAGTQITITGTGFGASQGSGNVWLGSTYGVVVSWSDTQVVANVASGSKTGVAQVLQGGVWSNSVNLTVSTPNIIGVTPTTGIAGTQITITGTGFGAGQGSGNVWLGSTYGIVVSWSDTQVVATVASGSSTGVAQVLQGGVWSNSVNFAITAANPPTISASASPAPNASGWNNSNVTVTFTCTAGSAPIANCPSPQTISSEGLNQVVSGTATDTNGLTATASVTLNIDKTPPAIAAISPADGTSFSTSAVTISGTATDSLSGVSSVTCDGAAASLSGGNFSCNISLNIGVNLVAVRVTDLAGNVAGSNFHLSLAGTLPAPNSLQITPSGVNMVVGQTQQFGAVDELGRPRSEATWTISDTTLASITTDSSPTLTALAVGQVTLTATVQNATTQIQVNILPGTSLSPGTVIWSAPAVPGFNASAILQAVPTAGNTPDLFAVSTDANLNTLIRAFSAGGVQMWQSSSISPGTAGANSVVPDGFGGTIVTTTSGLYPNLTTTLYDKDGTTGTQVWSYATQAQTSNKAIRQDGVVFHIETTAPDLSNSYSSSLAAVDGTVGSPLLRLPLPSGSVQVTDCNGVLVQNTTLGPSLFSNLEIDSDGTVSVALEVETKFTNGYDCAGGPISIPFNSTLYLFQLHPDGSTSLTPVHTNIRDLAHATRGTLPRAWPWVAIPDGSGGSLIAWTDYSSTQTPDYITHFGTSGQNDYPFPSLYQSISSMVLGDNDTAFATDSQTIQAFTLSTGQPLWTYVSQALDGIAIVASSSGGSLVAKEFPTFRTETVLGLDSTGKPTSANWSGSQVEYFLGSAWTSVTSGLDGIILGGEFDLAATPWNFSDQKQTEAASRPISLNVLKVIEANITDSYIQSQIKYATDYWGKKGLLFDWNGIPIGVPACDLQQWPSCTPSPADPHSIFDVLTDSNDAPAPNNQLSEVYRRFTNDPKWFKGITVLFVNSLLCNGTGTTLAYTLTATSNTPGRGSFLNVVLAESIDCTGTITNVPAKTLDHEFGHVFQLIHVNTGNAPTLGWESDIFTGIANLIVPATNLMCGPLVPSDEKVLDWLQICSISREFRYLFDFQEAIALRGARSLAGKGN